METLHYLLMKSHSVLNKRIISKASEIGLSAGQPKILEFLFHHGESNQKTISDYCEIEPATVGSILLRMEKSGLITRTQKEGNRRSLYVSLTAEGEIAARKMNDIFTEQETLACRDLTEKELFQLRKLLDRFYHSAEQNSFEMEEKHYGE